MNRVATESIMNERIKGAVMSEAEEIRRLHDYLREDSNKTSLMVNNLHTKIDDSILRNNGEHTKFMEKIAEVVTQGEVNRTKIIGLASITSLIVSGLVLTAFKVLAG